jgi:hypothetical protein
MGDAVRVDVAAGVCVTVGVSGVSVGRGEEVMVGVGDWYQRGVGEGVRVDGTSGVDVTRASGGYSSSMAEVQSSPPVLMYSLNRVAG